jgi:hypothetical protein
MPTVTHLSQAADSRREEVPRKEGRKVRRITNLRPYNDLSFTLFEFGAENLAKVEMEVIDLCSGVRDNVLSSLTQVVNIFKPREVKESIIVDTESETTTTVTKIQFLEDELAQLRRAMVELSETNRSKEKSGSEGTTSSTHHQISNSNRTDSIHSQSSSRQSSSSSSSGPRHVGSQHNRQRGPSSVEGSSDKTLVDEIKSAKTALRTPLKMSNMHDPAPHGGNPDSVDAVIKKAMMNRFNKIRDSPTSPNVSYSFFDSAVEEERRYCTPPVAHSASMATANTAKRTPLGERNRNTVEGKGENGSAMLSPKSVYIPHGQSQARLTPKGVSVNVHSRKEDKENAKVAFFA